MKTNRFFIFIFVFMIFSFPQVNAEEKDKINPGTNKMWVSLDIASDTALFKINLPKNGLVSILSTVPGRKQIDRLWGPRYMNKGTYKLPMPAGRVVNRSGFVQLFNVSLKPEKCVGQRGNGERQFSSPMGIDFDQSRKEILVADTGNDRIIRLAADGRFLSRYGGFGLSFGNKADEGEDSLDEPFDVSAGGFSNFYVSDQNNERICIFDSYKSYKGNLYPSSSNRRDRLDRPRGIKVDSENNIWLVDGRADQILKISPNGEKLFELGGFGYSSQKLKDPTQIDIDSNGEIYIADRGNGRIAIFDRLGSYLKQMKDHLKSPTGVAVDEDGLIFVCDESTAELGLYTPRGVRLMYIGGYSETEKFRKPVDLAVSSKRVYILDSGRNQIVFFDRQKTSTSVPWQAQAGMLE